MAQLPRKFNPGLNQDDQSLISQFVVRLPLLKILLETVEDNTTRPACQHRLYYGPRGRGKTMLMARVAAEIRVNTTLSQHWIAIRLFEESYCEIATIAEFWLEVMSELTLNLPEADKENAELSLKHLKENWSHPNLEQMAQGAVLEQLEKQGKKAIIMVENLHQLIDETGDDFGWAIRRVMQNEENIMFLATATTRFESLDNANDAFFEIFAISELKRLKRSDVAILWNAITKQDKTENEVAPLDILTGGSPRLLNIVAQFAKDSSIRELMENLTGLVDEHTEYFKSQVDALAPKERRIFLALADLWSESSAKEISERARMDIRATSALLGRLEQKGALKVNADRPRRKMYSIAERLFCIYYKLRREHSPDSVIEALVQFMVDFYTSEEIDEIRRLHQGKKLLSIEEKLLSKKLDSIYAEIKPSENHADIDGASSDLKEVIALFDRSTNLLLQQQGDTEQVFALYQTLIDRYQSREEAGIAERVAIAMYNQAVTHGQQGNVGEALELYQTLIDRYKSREEFGVARIVTVSMLNQANIQKEQGYTEKALVLYQILIDQYQSREEVSIVEWVVSAVFNQAIIHRQQGDTEQELGLYQTLINYYQSREEAEVATVVAKAMFNRAIAHRQQDNAEQELGLYQTLIDCYQSREETGIAEMVAKSLFNQAAIHKYRGYNEQALALYQNLIDRYQSREESGIVRRVAMAMINQAYIHGQQGNVEQELAVNQILIDRYQNREEAGIVEEVVGAMSNQALIRRQQGDTEQELALYQTLIECYQNRDEAGIAIQVVKAMINQASLFVIQQQWKKAAGNYQQLLSRTVDFSTFEISCSTASLGLLISKQAGVFSGKQRIALAKVIKEANQKSWAEERMTLALGIVAILPNEIALGIIEKSEYKDGLQPLLIALRQEMGETVRGSDEVLEVAVDVKIRIKELRKKYFK